MNTSDLRSLNVKELNERLSDEKVILNELVFKKAITGQIDKPHMLVIHRRNIAKINTVIRELELAENQA